MEDRVLLRESFSDHPQCALFGVFDGHGSSVIADFARATFARRLLDQLRATPNIELSPSRSDYLDPLAQHWAEAPPGEPPEAPTLQASKTSTPGVVEAVRAAYRRTSQEVDALGEDSLYVGATASTVLIWTTTDATVPGPAPGVSKPAATTTEAKPDEDVAATEVKRVISAALEHDLVRDLVTPLAVRTDTRVTRLVTANLGDARVVLCRAGRRFD
eukprot:GABV01001237.1.p1 GENE.GABV01001237.1~~GABV01001237.1.p1  ORF type:complete len:252 (-),score=64.59 GABV01001237.1:184-831(-)